MIAWGNRSKVLSLFEVSYNAEGSSSSSDLQVEGCYMSGFRQKIASHREQEIKNELAISSYGNALVSRSRILKGTATSGYS